MNMKKPEENNNIAVAGSSPVHCSPRFESLVVELIEHASLLRWAVEKTIDQESKIADWQRKRFMDACIGIEITVDKIRGCVGFKDVEANINRMMPDELTEKETAEWNDALLTLNILRSRHPFSEVMPPLASHLGRLPFFE
jgi:hypothetical protein